MAAILAPEEPRGGIGNRWTCRLTNSDVLVGTRRSIIIIRMSRVSRLESVGGSVAIQGQSGGGYEGEPQAFGNARFKLSATLRSMLYLILCRSSSMDFDRTL